MRAVGVVVLDELAQHYREVARSGDQQVVEAFAAQRADEAFGDRVGPRRPDWGADDADVGAGEHGVEGGGELAVPVADQEPELLGAVAEVHEQVAGLLGDPGAGGVGGDPGDVHAAAAVLDHHEDVEAAQEDGVDVGEVDREDRVGLRGEELSPGRAGPSRGGVEAGGLEDRPDGGGGDLVAEADQLALDAAVAPAWDSPGPSAAPAPGRVVRRVVGRVVVAGRSSGGRPAGRASAAGFGVRRAAAVADRPVGVGSAR